MIHRIFATGLLVAGLASSVLASDGRNAGSLLLYPEFDNRAGVVTVLTVTNVDAKAEAEDIRVHFHYIGKYDENSQPINCLEFDRFELLTPKDTLTLITNAHNPEHERGYVYLYAVDADNVTVPITHNYLTGNLMTVDGLEAFEYSMNPISYRGMTPAGTNTDVDTDDLRDLNDAEYSASAEEILIPRFLGQGGAYLSELILIALTGGTSFETTVDFLIFNDNEEIFSSEHTFHCWDRVPLLSISNIFSNDFLANWTNDDPQELYGAPNIETGWIRVIGAFATSTAQTIPHPSIYAVLVERIGNRGAADLPFERGRRTNGSLLGHGISRSR